MKVRTLHWKRAAFVVLLALLLSVAGVTNAVAQEFTVGNLNYSVNDDGISVTLTGHVDGESATGTLTILESVTYEGVVYPVTTIGENAFIFCSGLTGSLTIPNSVTTIGKNAFYNCSGFTGSLTIPNSVITIGAWAFCNCSGFTGNLVIPNSVTSIGGYFDEENSQNWEHFSGAFSGCSGFNGTLTLSNSLTEIGDQAFEGCSGFTGDLVIPNSVTLIGSNAFSDCYGFNGTLTLGNSVTTICNHAFSGCRGFTGDLVIPNSVAILGGYYYGDFFNYYSDSHVFAGCSGFNGTLTLSKCLTNIGSGAFYGCSGLTGDLVIPNSVESIGAVGWGEENDGAFEGCSGFTGDLTILSCASGGPNIGPNSFLGCSGFSGTLTLGANVMDIEANAFSGCEGFSSIILQDYPYYGNSQNVSQSAFTGVNTEIPVYVTCGTLESFQQHPIWSNFSNLQEPDPCLWEVIAVADPVSGGVVSGSGLYQEWSSPYCYATPNEGYTFYCWTYEYNGEVFSWNPWLNEVDFPNGICCNHQVYVAHFTPLPPPTITAVANPVEGGSVSGGGEYDYGTECTLAATANEGYTFMYWTEDGNLVSTDAIYSFTVTTDRNLVANFALPFSISVEANPTEGGIVSGGGEYDYGTECTLTATANEGYTFMYWTEDGNLVSTDAIYSFTVTTDRNLVANFALPFTITASANPPEGGTVTGSGMYDYGSTCTLTATAAEGYYFFGWKKDGVVVSSNGTYTFTVTENGDYIAVFEPGLYLGDGGTAINSYLPSHSYKCYTFSQQIYTADEIGMDGLITSIAFFNGNWTTTRNYNFYMINTDKTVFENSNDWITVTEEDLVYSGNVTMEAGTWTTIVLDTPFFYSVNSNLALITDDNTGSLSGHMTCRVFDADGSQAIYVYNNSTNFDPCSPSEYNGILRSLKNQIILGMVSASDTFVISTIVNPAEGGTVTGEGTYNYGETVILTATANEGYNFVSWTKEGEEVSTEATYSFTVTENATFVANFSESQGAITQTSNFSQGYNWWSTYIEQEGVNGLEMLENSLGGNGVAIRSQASGYTDFYGEDYGWWGSLTSINNESSYRVVASTPCTVTMTGTEAVPSQHLITLNHGWTWMGYVPSTAMDVNIAMAGMEASDGDMLKSQQGYADYYPNYGWYGSLNTIEPGMGLMYYSASGETVTFTYPDNTRGGELKANMTAENNHWKPNTFAYPDNMTVMAMVELNDEELSNENYELAAFANGECRGSVRLTYAEPLHRHLAFLTISGKDAAELSFRLYDTETGMEYYDAEESLDFVANAIVGMADDLYTIHFRGMTGMDELANRVKVYPNPVNHGEQFSIGLADTEASLIRLEIVDALGAIVSAVTSTKLPASLVAPETTGVYTVKILVDNKAVYCRKLVVR